MILHGRTDGAGPRTHQFSQRNYYRYQVLTLIGAKQRFAQNNRLMFQI